MDRHDRKRNVSAVVIVICLLTLWSQIHTDSSLPQTEGNVTEESAEGQEFAYIMEGDYSSLEPEEGILRELKALMRHGYCEWNLCDVNGDKKEELVLQQKQENMGDDIRCIIGIFAEEDSGVECVLWDTDYDTDECYAWVGGKLIYYQDMYEIYRYASYSLCYFDESWEIEKENRFEIIQIDNLELYNEYNKNGEWRGIEKIETAEEGDYYRYVSYEETDVYDKGVMLQKDNWMDKFQEELTAYENVEKVLGKGFYTSMNRKTVSEVEDFEGIMQGDMSSLYQLEEKERDFVKKLAKNGYNEWNVCDVNGDGKEELILQERQGELGGNIGYIIGIFAETEDGVKRVLWDVFETGEYYSFIDGNLLHYYYVSGTHTANLYTLYRFDDAWEIRAERTFQIIRVDDFEEYKGLSDELKKEITDIGFYYRYVIYDENGEKNTMLLSEKEWLDKFQEELGEYGRVSTIMQGFAPFDIYEGLEENLDEPQVISTEE